MPEKSNPALAKEIFLHENENIENVYMTKFD